MGSWDLQHDDIEHNTDWLAGSITHTLEDYREGDEGDDEKGRKVGQRSLQVGLGCT